VSDDEARRRSFDAVADAYEAERPGYPDALFDDLLSIARVGPGARVLELGCGTGKATRSLLARGLHVTAIELGPNLAALTRELFAGQPLTIHVARFETWDAPSAAFDLVVSAQAFHWIDPDLAGPKIVHTLVPGAIAAFFWNIDAESISWLDPIYATHAPELDLRPDFPPVDVRIAEQRARVERGGALEVFDVRRYPWTLRRDAAAYIRLIDTYSDHQVLSPATKSRLYPAIQSAIDARGGTIERPVVAYTLLARPCRP
jgi:SAM-dependent methyltransferase